MRPADEIIRIWSNYLDAEDPEESDYLLDLKSLLYSLPYLYGGVTKYHILDLLSFSINAYKIEPDLANRPLNSEISFDTFIEQIHPNEIFWYVNMHNELKFFLAKLSSDELPNYTFCCYIRKAVPKTSHTQSLIQQLFLPLRKTMLGRCKSFLIIHTDLPYRIENWRPSFSIFGNKGSPTFRDIPVRTPTLRYKDFFTKREKEILSLLKLGSLSKEISCSLNISKNTVDRHRKNMLAKTGCGNTTELVIKATEEGWI
jgi:DNA-binding CsgD family transcriptional regulator